MKFDIKFESASTNTKFVKVWRKFKTLPGDTGKLWKLAVRYEWVNNDKNGLKKDGIQADIFYSESYVHTILLQTFASWPLASSLHNQHMHPL